MVFKLVTTIASLFIFTHRGCRHSMSTKQPMVYLLRVCVCLIVVLVSGTVNGFRRWDIARQYEDV